MDLLQEVEVLRRVPMFSRLDPPRLKLLAFTSEQIVFEDGEELFHVGDPADAAYVILDGEADVMADTASGEIVAVTLGKNQLFGELAVLSKAQRSATMRAKGKLQTLRIADEAFLKLVTENPEVALGVMRQLSEKLAKSVRQFENLHSRLQQYERTSGEASAQS